MGHRAALLFSFLVLHVALVRAEALPPRYDFRPGDRLVYRAVLERDLTSEEGSSTTRVEWETSVVFLDGVRGALRVGFQRSRRQAEILRYRSRGRDRQKEERARFEEDLTRRPAVVAEGNLVTLDGQTQLPWAAVREWSGELLPLVHEIEELPTKAVAPGDRWPGGPPLGLPFRAVGLETVLGEECLHVEGEGGPIKAFRYFFCPGSGTLARLQYEGQYAAIGTTIREKFSLERVGRRRGEDPREWLADPAARQGTLAALLASPKAPLGPDAIYTVLASGEAGVQRLALALAWREGWPPPPIDTLGGLLGSENPRVRTLAARLAGTTSGATALLEKAAGDDDAFVRAAARRAAKPTVSSEEALRVAREARTAGPPVEWRCGDDPDRASHGVLAQRAGAQPPGSTLRMVRRAPFTGWPYVVHVPEDYRGDEPFPLVIVLGGGPGRAFATAQGAFGTIDPLGYLAVYPQANGMWWDERPTAAVAALIPEVLAEYNVDPNRVYLTGFSNGGTGTLLYAALFGHRLAAAAPLMGAGLAPLGPRVPSAPGLTLLPLLFVHGDRDEVIPSFASHDAVKAIRREDPAAPVEEHVLKGRGHDVRLGYDDGLVMPFFERHLRDPFPKRVRLRAPDLSFARSFWVEVLEKSGGTAEVDGTIEGASIALRTRNVKRLRLRLRRELLPGVSVFQVRLNGREVFSGPLEEDCGLLLRSWRETGDPFLAHAWERTFDTAP
ncbi:MAG: dienelactone hydrolase family protein [Solirubrobacterales bacterium]